MNVSMSPIVRVDMQGVYEVGSRPTDRWMCCRGEDGTKEP